MMKLDEFLLNGMDSDIYFLNKLVFCMTISLSEKWGQRLIELLVANNSAIIEHTS